MPVKSIRIKGTRGLKPADYYRDRMAKLVAFLNDEGTALETEVVNATPANMGQLRRGWKFVPATSDNPKAVLGQSVQYFLPVEMGRKPGKGISAEGQKSVKRWAKLVLGLSSEEQSDFAFLLSQKYKAQGRPAVGFLGLARQGTIPTSRGIPDEPVSGSLLDLAFKRFTIGLRNL